MSKQKSTKKLDTFDEGNTITLGEVAYEAIADPRMDETPIVIKIGNKNHYLSRAYRKSGKLILVAKR